MPDRAVFIGFGQPVRGREERAVEVFNDFVGMFGRMAADGRIEDMDVTLLDPHGGELGGFFMVHGSAEQCTALQMDEEFRSACVDANLIVDDFGVVPDELPSIKISHGGLAPSVSMPVPFAATTGGLGSVTGGLGSVTGTLGSPPPTRPGCSRAYWVFLAATGRARTGGSYCPGEDAPDAGPFAGEPVAQVLAYGTRWSSGGLRCTSAVEGLTCRNTSGHGFFLSRENWRAF